ncbi:hypothetical protein ACFDR9_001922 [Janthinobacterium sp. CG_23.3]|uniref:hypothetical protein n=1 Tax=unclassified Janthinobacterium TaxID=2610881 RepID=UPI000346F688|nr:MULTISPECIES: hypothetical protein [unclassified Janthinobacterium]MEC5162527.1 hypothetical protein [Janthinobacterium sp. CG_S6]
MNNAYLLVAGLAALCFYLASPHQRLWRGGLGHARSLRAAGALGGAGAVAAAAAPLGFCAGLFAALAVLMLALVALPYVDLYRRTRNVG